MILWSSVHFPNIHLRLLLKMIEHAEGWTSTDLRGRILVEPYWSTMTSGVTVAEEDMQGVHAYFWEAPQQARPRRSASLSQF